MLSWIIPYLKTLEPRNLPAYRVFINSLTNYLQIAHRRFMLAPSHESWGIRMLRYILQFADIPYMDTQVNNYHRYSYHVRFIRRDLMNIFDRVHQGQSFRNLFFDKNQGIVEEYLFPVEDINSLVNLPLESYDWNIWKNVRPLRLWAYNTTEYTTNILNDQVHYRHLPPAYAVELLDVVALVFKYYTWLKVQRDLEPDQVAAQQIPQQLFLHKYVFCDWIYDLVNVWLLGQLHLVLKEPVGSTLDSFDVNFLCSNTQYSRLPVNIQNAFGNVYHLVQDIKAQVRPEAFLSTPLLLGGSINDRILITDKYLTLPILAQYDYLRWMRDRDVLRLVMDVYNLRPVLPLTRFIKTRLRRDVDRCLKRKPWNVFNNIVLKQEIAQDIQAFAQEVEK